VLTVPEFRAGAWQTAPQIPGLAAWGLMTGVAMTKSGLSLVEALAMTLFIYAGSAQLAALPLLAAGAPLAVVLATAFCVNLRFVVFSLHLRQYLMHLPWGLRVFTGYLTADMNYALFTQRFPEPASEPAGQRAQHAFLLGSNALTWAAWMVASVAGSVLAHAVPERWGLGFAGILALVGILCSLATHWLRVVACAVAGAVAVAAYALPLRLNIVVAIAVTVIACLLIESLPRARRSAP
jgi:predicted branched-subunit amino acid permease